jgi:uncharacterized phage infection (PIP) family protein YhgE
MPDWAKELLGYGPLGVIAIAVGWMIYKIITQAAPAAWLLGERYISSTEDLHASLKDSQREQQATCKAHVAGLDAIGSLIESQVAIGTTARDQAASGNLSLQHIDQVLTDRTHLLEATANGVTQLKSVAMQACEMCKKVSAQFPQAAAEVATHCDAIKRKLEETV